MKRFLPFLVAVAAVATMVVLPAEADADWRLYDNFNYGTSINADRWIIDSSSANISIVGGKAKFVHLEGHPNDSAWLGIKIAPETVKGIKAKVTVASCTGDVRARIGGYIGKVDDYYVWNQLGLDAGISGGISSPRIFSVLNLLGDPPGFPYSYIDLFYGQFIRPLDIIGHTFTLIMTFSREEVTYKVSGLGEIEHEFPEDLSPTDFHFKGIGTYSPNGNGPCVVYFDDVYVLR
jgi:hypothetical protein